MLPLASRQGECSALNSIGSWATGSRAAASGPRLLVSWAVRHSPEVRPSWDTESLSSSGGESKGKWAHNAKHCSHPSFGSVSGCKAENTAPATQRAPGRESSLGGIHSKDVAVSEGAAPSECVCVCMGGVHLIIPQRKQVCFNQN